MSHPHSVSLRDVAKHAGLSTYTVSLGLRGDPRVPDATRKRVEAAAAELGYRANPLVRANMTLVRTRRKSPEASTLLGLIYESHGKNEMWLIFRDFILGAKALAPKLGFTLDLFDLSDPRYAGAALERTLRSRNIRGLLLAPLKQGRTRLDLDYNHYAVVACGYSTEEPVQLTRVSPDHYNNMGIVLDNLLRSGYRRIGLVVPETQMRRVNYLWHARYLEFLHGHAPAATPAIPVFETPLDRNYDPAAFRQWFERHRPEVILTNDEKIESLFAAAKLRIPEDAAWATLDWGPHYHRGRASGCDQRFQSIGGYALELLARKLYHNEYGLAPYSQTIEIRGNWVEGDTTPPRSSPSD